jgi:hypothetical protein
MVEDAVIILAHRSLPLIVSVSTAMVCLAGCVSNEQAASSNPALESQCIRVAQRAAPGSYMSTGVMDQRTAIFRSCMANGGTLPSRRRL